MRWVALLWLVGGCGAASNAHVDGTVAGRPLAARVAYPVLWVGGDVGFIAVDVSNDPAVCANFAAGARTPGATTVSILFTAQLEAGKSQGVYGIVDSVDAGCTEVTTQLEGTALIDQAPSAPPFPMVGQPFRVRGSFDVSDKRSGDRLSGSFDSVDCDAVAYDLQRLRCPP